MSEFLSMGGYAVFVWPAFFVSFIVLGAVVIVSLRAYREQQSLLSTLESEETAGTSRQVGGSSQAVPREAG